MAFDEEQATREAASRLVSAEPPQTDTGPEPFDADRAAEDAALGLVREDRQRQSARLQSYELGETASPDDAALHDRLAQKYGVPRRAVEYDSQSYKDKEAAERHALLERTSPGLVNWIDDADNYAIARDDVDTLGKIEKLLKDPHVIGRAVKAGNWVRDNPKAFAVQVGDVGRSTAAALPSSYGMAISGLGETLNSYIMFNRNQVIGNIPGINKLADSADAFEARVKARNPELAKAIEPWAGPGTAMKTFGGSGKEIAASWRPDSVGIEDQIAEGLGQIIVAVGTGIVTGGSTIATVGFMGMGADQQAESIKQAGLDPSTMPLQLTTGAAITGTSEMLRLNSMLKILPPGVRERAVKGALARIAGQSFEEGTQEVIEGLGHNLLTMTYDEDARIFDTLAEQGGIAAASAGIFQAIVETALPGKARGPKMQGDSLAKELDRLRNEVEPTEGEVKLGNLIDLAVQSKTAQRSPEKIEQYIGGMLDETTATVAIDAEGLAQVIEDNRLDEASVLMDLGLESDALQKATEQFGDLEVSTAKLAASRMLKNGTLVKEHARFSSEEMTPSQREQRRESDVEGMKQVFTDFLQGKVDAANADQSVTEQFMARIEETGMYGNAREVQANATVLSALVGSLAKVRGIPVQQAFEEHAFAIEAHFGLGGASNPGALDQDGLPMDEPARMARAKADGFDTDTVLYHGTVADFDAFDTTRARAGDEALGVHLGTQRQAEGVIQNGNYILGRGGPEFQDGANVRPLFARIQRPLRLPDLGHWSREGLIEMLASLPNPISLSEDATTEEIKSAITGAGFDAIVYANEFEGAGDSYIVFDPKNIRSKFAKFDPEKRDSANLLDQPGLSGQFSPRDNIIHLSEAKNVSTLMHESAHWYLQTLIDLQARGQSTPEIDSMLAGVQEWYDAARAEGKYDEIVARYDIVETGGKFVLTYEGEERGQFFSREEAEQKRNWREMHEAFAETFEVYLRDGKAPNAKLRDAFRFFRDFLTNLYRKVKGNPSLSRANLNPEITAIFDRMLAVDDMVDGASSVMEIEANQMLQKMLDDGVLTEKEHARAVAKFPKMLAEMKEDLSARLWNSAQKRQDALMAGFKRDIRDAVAREYDTSPVGRAEGMLGRNEWMGDVAEDAVVDDVDALTQEAPRSLRAMTRMTEEQIGEWYVENVREVSQNIGDNYRVVNLHFKTDDSLEREDAVVNFKIDGNKVNADLYLNSKTTADVNIKELTDAERRERQRKAANMFARAVAAIKHWVALEQPGAVVFSGSSTDHEKLYNFMLSTLAFEGYTAHRVNTIIGRITTEDNVTEGEAILPPMQQFVVLKDGESLGDYSETESVKGRSGVTDTGTWQGYHAVHTEEIGPVRSADGRYERRGSGAGAVGTQRGSSGTQSQIEGATDGNAQGNNGLDGSVSDGKLQGPVVLPDGTTELVHYGREQGLSRSDPSRWGAGGAFLPRSERNRISDAPARTYFGLNVGLPGGYTKEEGTGDNTYYSYIPFDRLYDFGADADNLVERGREIARERRIDVLSAVEHAVKAAGYAGFYRDHPSLGMVGAVFEEMELASERRQEAVSAYESITEPGLYQRTGDGRGRDPGRRLAPLAGAPSVQGATGPDARIVSAAEDYAQSKGIDLRRQSEFVTVDEARAKRIADAYEQMQHAPNDPAVQEAYASLIAQTIEQYNALTDAGFSFTFFDDATDPYAGNPWNAMRDLRSNQTMAVYGTYAGYGTEGITASALADNPMLSDTGLRWPDQNGVDQIVTANDLFRAVHDAFGHGIEGAGFRARGEENAWQAHVRLFTGPAIGAITSETRGQNSWLNFGPYGESNRSAQLEDTVFAEQKTGLMPEWTWQEGRARDVDPDPDALNQTISTYQDRVDFLEHEAVSEPMEGEPKGSVRYAFKLPGQIEPVMVDVVVDPEYNAQHIRIGQAVQDGAANMAVSFETGLRDLAVRLYAIVERHIRKGPLFFRTTSAEDRAFTKEILTHAAEQSAQDLRVHTVNNHTYLIQRPGTVSTSDGSVSNGGFQNRKEQGRPSASARAAFYRRAKSHNPDASRAEAAARRNARRESERGPVRSEKPNPLGSLFTPDPDALDQTAPTFYSALERFVSQSQTARASAEQWKATISKAPGIKAEEIEWTGVNDWLDAQIETHAAKRSNQPLSIAREELADYLNANGVQVEEILATENGENVGELEWDNGRVWEDAEAWEHDVEDIVYEQERYNLETRAIDAIRDDEKDYIRSNMDPDDLALAEADLSGTVVDDWLRENFASEIDDKMREFAEAIARDNYFDNPIYIYETEGDSADIELSIFGNSDVGYSIREGGWRFHQNEIAGFGEIYSLSEAQVQAQAYAENNNLVQSEDSPERTKWGEHVMRGSSDNYRELKLTLPDIQEDFYNETHFADRNIVAFLRLTDRDLPTQDNVSRASNISWTFKDNPSPMGRTYIVEIRDDAGEILRTSTIDDKAEFEEQAKNALKSEGGVLTNLDRGGQIISNGDGSVTITSGAPRESTFFIDEFQSDWHQQGRQEGYNTPEDKAKSEAAIEAEAEKAAVADKEARALSEEYKALHNQIFDGGMFDDPSSDNYQAVALENQIRFRQGLEKIGITVPDKVGNVMNWYSEKLSDIGFGRSTVSEAFPGIDDNSFVEEMVRVNKAFEEARHARDSHQTTVNQLRDKLRNNVPNAPFRGDAWVALGMKRAIRMAVDEGRSAIGWPDSEVLVDRWAERYRELYINQYDRKMVKAAAKLLKAKPVHLTLDGELYTDEHRENGEQGYWIVELTDEMKATAEQGFPLFQKRRNPDGWGAVTPPSNVSSVRLDLKSVRDAYGDEAVDRLPRSVIERATSSNTVGDMMDQIETIKADLKAKPPKSLFAFVRSRGRKGKIKGPNGISGAADDLKALGLEKLINEKSGRDIDYVRELAEEAGYLQPSPDGQTTSINDLLEALQRELRGDPVYAEPDLADASAHENADGWRVFLDENDVDIYEEDAAVLEAAVRKFVEGAQEDAVTADEAADMFGFDTGEDLITALINEGDRERVIRDETERRFKEEYGDLYESGQLANEIEMEVNTELRARKAELEFEALTRAAGRLPARRLARQMAQESLSIMPIGEINRRFKSWRRDAETHGRNALAEAQKGNWDKVTASKKYELVALSMHEEGAKLLERAEKVRADLVKYETSKYRREKIANDYLERIDAMLEGYELRKSKQGPSEQRRRQSAADYVAWMTAEGREDEIAAEASLLAEMANDKVWRNLTIDEADYLHATVKNLAHLGRTKDRLLNEQDKRRFNAVIDELVGRMKDTGKLPPIMGLKFTSVTRDRSPTRTVTETAVDALREGNSWLMRPEHQARSLDGEELGPVWQAIFRPMAEASDVETRMMRESTALYREAWSKFSAKDRKRMMNVNVSVPELRGIGKRFTRMDLISIALNWGVEYNRDVLMEGYGWNKQQVESALFRTLGDKEWDFVESIWKIAGMHKDEAFALEKDMTGVEPKAVEGVSFTLPGGRVIEGKYYHIEYDGNQPGEASRRQLKDNAAAELSTHRKSRTKAQTRNGGLIERKGSGGRPVKLSLSVFEKGLSETIHDIAFRRAVMDVGRIVSDKSFADTYQEIAGLENYRQLDVWLKDIANPPSEALDPIVRAFAHVRRNIPIAVMGMKVGTALIQPSGILAAMPIVGHRRMALAVAQAFANPNKSLFGAWSAVAEKSEFMRDRIAGYERDVRETTTALTKGGATDFLRRNAFVFINGMDVAVSTPVWMAAYGKAMDGKVKGIRAGQEEDAILWADGVIRRTQTAGKMQDLSRFQRGGEFQKQISMIFSYFNNLYALSAQNTMDMRRGKMTRIAWAYQMSILFVAIPLMAEAMAGRLFPSDDDDDDETLAGNMGQAVISNFAGMFPGIRDVVSLNLKPEFGYRLSPTAKFIEDIGKTAGLPFQLALDSEKELTEYDVKRAVNAVGGMTGIPSAQINITGDYIVDLIEGNEDPAGDPVDAMSEAFVRNTR